MIEQFHVVVPEEMPGNGELFGDHIPIVVADGLIIGVFIGHLCQQGRPHVLSVAPHLVSIRRLMPPASSGLCQGARLDDVVVVGHADAFEGIGEALLGRSDGVGIRVVGTVGEGTACCQLLQLEIELHGIEVVETHASLSARGDVEVVAVILDGIEPRPDVNFLLVFIVVDGFEDGFCHQSRHVVEVELGVVGGCDDSALTVEHAKACRSGVSLEIIDTRIDDELGIAHAFRKRAWLTCFRVLACCQTISTLAHCCQCQHQHIFYDYLHKW